MRVKVRQDAEEPLWFDDAGKPFVPACPWALVFDRDSGKEITYCIFADDVTGEYEQFVISKSGRPVLVRDRRDIVRRRGRANLRFEFLTMTQTTRSDQATERP